MRALCILHDAFSSTGLIGQALRARGWDVAELLVVPADRHATPDVQIELPDWREYDLLIPMGSPWSAYDDAAIGSWLTPELAWLKEATDEGRAVFGICFGAQALARARGGSVARAERAEIGWMHIEPTDPLVETGPWFQWHFDALTPPPGAVTLARSPAAVQAFRVGRSLGVQFHPEITAAGIAVWLEHGGAAEALAQGIEPAKLLHDAARERDAAKERAAMLVDAYLAKVFPGR